MEKPQVEVRKIPDLVAVDNAIRKLHIRVEKLEGMMRMALQQGGPHWVNQVVRIALELERVVDSLHRTVHKYNNIKARLFK